MADTYLIDELVKEDPRKLPLILREAAADPDLQERVLLDIVNYAKDTEFGRAHGFAEIRSADDFKKRVPVTDYEGYRPYVNRMADSGESDVLIPGRTPFFAVTTGTTGKAKYIPDSERGMAVKDIVSVMRQMEMIRMMPGMADVMNAKILIIANTAVYGKTKAGIATGSASGMAANDERLRSAIVPPAEMLSFAEVPLDEMDYLTMLFALAEENILGLSLNNVIHFHNMLKKAEARAEQLINDIKCGTISADISEERKAQLMKYLKPDPERADKLKDIFDETGGFPVEKVWVNFGCVCCWMSGSVGRGVREYRNIFPEKTVFLDWGYGASEGKFNIPDIAGEVDGLPAVFGYYFEFLPLGGVEPLSLSQTENGGVYELIETSYAGFYRYNIHDIVLVTIKDGIRRMRFLCKTSESLPLGDKRLYASELTDIIQAYEDTRNICIRHFECRKADSGIKLSIELGSGDLDMNDFRKFARDELAKKGFRLSEIAVLPDGYRDSLFGTFKANGKTVNQTKLAVFPNDNR